MLAVGCVLVFGGASALAGLIAQDDFESYPLGQLEPASGSAPYGGTGWATVWNVLDAERARVQVVAHTMSYIAGTVYSQGGSKALRLEPGNDSSGMLLMSRSPGTLTGTVYVSLLLQAPTILQNTGGNTTDDFLQFGMDSSVTNPRVSGGVAHPSGNPNPYFFARTTATAGNSTFGTVAVDPAQTYLVVLKFSGGYDRTDVYINPVSNDESAHTPITRTGTSGATTLSELIFRTARHESGLDWYYIDNVMVGTTFADVVPIPEPSSLALWLLSAATLSLAMLAGRRSCGALGQSTARQ